MPDLAIIVPTRGRPDNIERVISAWDFTNAWDHADLILVADADDPEIQGYRQVVEATEHPDTGEALVRLLEIPQWMPMVHKLDLAAREMAELYWAVGFAGDDHLPQTIGWAARYLTVLRELGTGMVYGDDGYQGAKLATEWAMTSDVVRALGRMVPAPVEHMFCDNAVLELFTVAGAARHLPEVRIEHRHPYAGKAASDAQYERVNSRDQMGRDRRTFRKWQAATLATQAATVRALRRGQPETRPARPTRTARRQGRIMMRPPRFFKRVRAATPEDVMLALADFAAQVPGDQEIVELGVFHGRTALQLAWGARQGQRAHVTAIDPWDLPGNDYGPPFTDPGARRWAHHHVKSLGYSRDITLVQAFSHDAAAGYDGPPIGLLFVDGDHTKTGARRDIEAWAPHLAEGARIAVDDYGHPDWPGVKEALDELVAEGVLEPVEVFHERLAVTRLATSPEEPGRTTAVTSEGVRPSPEPRSDICRECGSGLLPDGEHVRTDLAPCYPSPYPAAEGQIADEGRRESASPPAEAGPDRSLPMPWSGEREPSVSVDDEVSTNVRISTLVRPGELEGVADWTEINTLTIPDLKALAKHRGIVLGVRKDKRAEIIQAIKDGR